MNWKLGHWVRYADMHMYCPFLPCILVSQHIKEHRRAEINGEHHAGIIMPP